MFLSKVKWNQPKQVSASCCRPSTREERWEGEEHVILKYGTDLWTTEIYFGLHIHVQSSACQQLSRFSLIGASSQPINTPGQRPVMCQKSQLLSIWSTWGVILLSPPPPPHALFSRPAPRPASNAIFREEQHKRWEMAASRGCDWWLLLHFSIYNSQYITDMEFAPHWYSLSVATKDTQASEKLMKPKRLHPLLH